MGDAGGRGRGGHPALLTERTERLSREKEPAHIDWRNTTAARHVLDQGACGSCWAVATTAMLESHYEIHRKEKRSFSAQELVHCVENKKKCGGTGGCEGATVELAMDYVQKNGLAKTEDQPYKGADLPRDAIKCPGSAASGNTSLAQIANSSYVQLAADSGRMVQGLIGWETLPKNEALPLMKALLRGPAAISAAAAEWSNYQDGIFNGCQNDFVINHAVLLVGFGYEMRGKRMVNYWTVQNSWGKDWGEDGFIRIHRLDTTQEDSKHCGIDREPDKGVECEPYPASVTVCGTCGILYDSVSLHFENAAASAENNSLLQVKSSERGFLRGRRL